jgi:hypothetical protein
LAGCVIVFLLERTFHIINRIKHTSPVLKRIWLNHWIGPVGSGNSYGGLPVEKVRNAIGMSTSENFD